MPELSRALDIWREIANACACHIEGTATDTATTSVTIADYPLQTNRANASNRSIEGGELYLTDVQASSTLTAALTAAGSSFSVASGTDFAASAARPYLVAIDEELILVTLSGSTFTVVRRGELETRAAAHVSGATVYGPFRTPNPNGIGAFAASTGVITPSVTYNEDPGGAMPFSIFTRGVRLTDIQRATNRAIRELFYEDYIPLTLVTDGDMRSPGTADWTAGGSPTISKVTNSNAVLGPRSLRVLATVANDFAQSATILVNPDNASSWYVRALVRADVGTCTLRAWDVTNGAAITSETWTDRGWGILDFTFTLPATCQALAFRLISVSSTSDAYWAYVQATPQSAYELMLPAWVIRSGMVKELIRDTHSSRDRWDDPHWWPANGRVIPDPSNPNNQFKFQFHSPTSGPYWIHAARQGEMLTADAQTTFVDRTLLVAKAAYLLSMGKARGDPSAAGLQWRREAGQHLKEWAAAAKTQVPVPIVEAGYSRSW